MTLHCSVDSISTKMRRPLFLTLCFILLVDDVLTVTEDKLLEEPEIEEQKGVDERAEGLMARLEALREVEEELAEFREESRGGLGGNLSQLPMLRSEVLNSRQGNLKAEKKKGPPNDAGELLARLSAKSRDWFTGGEFLLHLEQESRGNERKRERGQGAACQADSNQGVQSGIWSGSGEKPE